MNRYRGINAHLHSYFQTKSGWAGFHTEHITHLREAIDRVLPPGYYVLAEQSLQLAFYDVDHTIIQRHRPDVAVYGQGTAETQSSTAATATPTTVFPIEVTLSDPEFLASVVIIRNEHPVTRIELLSPANKPPGSHYRDYLSRRDDTIAFGINLIEIDYLHERRSPISVIPDYTQREPGSYPYSILVNEPQQAETRYYGFRVDDPLPMLHLPLADDDRIQLDFGQVYDHTFNANSFYSTVCVNYDEPPLNFDSYDPTDQQRIQEVMQRDP